MKKLKSIFIRWALPWWCAWILSFIPNQLNAQIVHKVNAVERYGIDAKRRASYLEGKELLLRSREFINADSSYYVGHMLEGFYKANHASDYFGYEQAIKPLDAARLLLEKDYMEELVVHTKDYYKLLQAYDLQHDYQTICYELFQAYMNTLRYQDAWNLAKHVAELQLQTEYVFNSYTSMTWLVNKIRTYTRDDFPFLKNSIEENIAFAQRLLDTAMMRNENNRQYNDELLPGLYENNLNTVHHYRALLYAYSLNTDSADKYYDLLKQLLYYSHNNRGNYLTTKGLFRQAEIEYQNEQFYRDIDYSEKNLKEFIYYRSIIDLYKGQPDSAINRLQEVIKTNGSTPGFGWYQIALARASVYGGNIQAASKAIKKAGKFQELHIGTSLGQQHYDFSLEIVRYIEAKSTLAWIHRRYKNCWLRISLWPRLLALHWRIYSLEYKIVSLLKDNKERASVIYPIFATESVISWDEFYKIIGLLDNKYFIELYQQKVQEDKRFDVIRYYKLFLAKLHWKNGDLDEAISYLDQILGSGVIDFDYEKLFLARCYELYAQILLDQGKKNEAAKFIAQMYNMYPQQVAYSSLPIKFHIHWTSGNELEALKKLIEKSNITLTNKAGSTVPEAEIKLSRDGDNKIVEIIVKNTEGQIINNQHLISKDDTGLAHSIVKALFGMNQSY